MSNPDIIPLSAIDFTANRDMGDLTGLQTSIQKLGTIHPPVLSRYVTPSGETRYKPVAGRRRLHAIRASGATELFHNSVLEPSRPGFQYKEDVPEDELAEATLDENLYRLKPKWQEDALLVLDIHNLKRAKVGARNWGQRQTAELLGMGNSKSNVNMALKVAELLLKGDKEILACENLSDANALRLKRCEDGALEELNKRALTMLPQAVPSPSSPTSTSTFLDSFNLKGGDEIATGILPGPITGESNVQSLAPSIQTGPLQTVAPVQVPLSQMFMNKNFRDCIGWSQVNHIVTDIPYGIDMDNLNKSSKLADVTAEHEVEANIDLMRPFLEFAWATIKPQGFCVFFYDQDHHEKLQGWARDIGFKVQRWALIWNKLHTCQNNAAQYNTTKNYECAMILRKDEHTVLRSQQPTSIFSCDGSAERKLYQNPFAKPFDLWKWIFDMIAFPGQTVLDPFCGEMSSCRAALNCGLIPYGIEINPKHYNRGLENMRKAYAVIHKSNCTFT